MALHPRSQVLPRRVVEKILPNAQPRIGRTLRTRVLVLRPRRRHLQHGVRPLAFLPDLAIPPHPVLHHKYDEHVERHRHPGIDLLSRRLALDGVGRCSDHRHQAGISRVSRRTNSIAASETFAMNRSERWIREIEAENRDADIVRGFLLE